MSSSHLQVCEGKINTWILVGAVLKDPVIRYFQSGKCKATSFLELERPGATTEWLPLEMWGKVAEFSNFVRKDSLVAIKGSLKFLTGRDRVDLCCLVSELELLSKGVKNVS
jgi:single-stranded DNA-binding protein